MKKDKTEVMKPKVEEAPFPLGRERPEQEPVVVVRGRALRRAREHARSDPTREVCGLLAGRVCRDEDGVYHHVREILEAKGSRQAGSQVTFTAEAWKYLHDRLDREFPELSILGWYHSHPNYGIFLSKMDRFIHEQFFNQPWHFALVVDPIRAEAGLFGWKDSKVQGVSYLVEGAEESPLGDSPKPQDPVRLIRRELRALALLVFILLLAVLWFTELQALILGFFTP